MTKSRTVLTLATGAVVLGLLGSCSATAAGGSQDVASVNLSFQATGLTPESPSVSAAASAVTTATATTPIPVTDDSGTAVGEITLSDARLSVEEIDLQNESETGEDRDVRFERPRVIDLMDGTVTPAVDTTAIPVGTYVDIEIDLNEVDDHDTDGTGAQLVQPGDPLYGYSMYLAGTYTPAGGSPVPFSFSSAVDASFELAPNGVTNGFSVAVDQDNQIIVAFRVAQWFGGIGEEMNALATAGAITLDGHAADNGADETALLRGLFTAISRSADFGRDTDNDHVLDVDEHDEAAQYDHQDELAHGNP